MPHVSVIITTYNRKKLLTEALASVYHQTYQDFEIILIDDGSVDGTQEMIAKMKQPRLRYYYQENHGLTHAWNRGVKLARGEWIAFLDSDDIWKPEKLRVQIEQSIDPKIFFIYCAVSFITQHGLKLSRHPGGRTERWYWSYIKRFYPSPVKPSTLMIKRKIILDYGGFDPVMGAAADSDLFMRLGAIFSPNPRWFLFSRKRLVYARLPYPRTDEKAIISGWDPQIGKLDLAAFRARWSRNL